MEIRKFIQILSSDFYTGVPDSQLRALCDYLMVAYGTDPRHHIIAANEGNAVGLAAGYYLATGKLPVVYLQNSGIGNITNPVASLLNEKVYGIPCLFVIGWRGEPRVQDEPQHIFQGEQTLAMLESLGIPSFVLSGETAETEVREAMKEFRTLLAQGRQAAFVVRKGALTFDGRAEYGNHNAMYREEVIRHITAAAGDDPIVSTTGKASRELFEIREANGQGHGFDFLTVGSMGHSSSIALGIALNRPEKKIWCVDGDGAVLMHMGAMAVIGANSPKNLVHIVINNSSHETVGGMPTVAEQIHLTQIAKGCGYSHVICVSDFEKLDKALQEAKKTDALSFIEVKCAIGSRRNLGRPTTTPLDNKTAFMNFLACGRDTNLREPLSL